MPLPPTGDTIAAIATAPGAGAIGIVRVSGPRAYAVADEVFRPETGAPASARAAGRVVFGHAVDGAEVLDEALLLTFRRPRSYTGQDLVEIQTHGGPAVLRAVLGACLRAGARAAGPGEYTLRAYLQGRLDLAQAESVLDLVNAQAESARRNAALGLTRALQRHLDDIQTQVTRAYAAIQAVLDYPEEGVPEAELDAPLADALAHIDRLLATAAAGSLSRRGARLALVGRPNAGKSSLLNALLGYERSIVSATPGTTRDYLEAPLVLGGVAVTAIDTAGVRETDDDVEATGVAAARQLAQSADLCLVLLDRSRALAAEDWRLVRELSGGRTLLLATKGDLPPAWGLEALPRPALVVSATTGMGLERLQDDVRDALLGDAAGAELWIAHERHAQALRRARDQLERARAAPADLAALDLQEALESLATITGRSDVGEETLAEIFARFCVGK